MDPIENDDDGGDRLQEDVRQSLEERAKRFGDDSTDFITVRDENGEIIL